MALHRLTGVVPRFWHRVQYNNVCRCIRSAVQMQAFTARAAFPVLDSLKQSYYLGHHAAGVTKMASMISQIDLVIECRDYRVPISSRNPLFEATLAGKQRLIVYTKRDLGGTRSQSKDLKVCKKGKVMGRAKSSVVDRTDH